MHKLNNHPWEGREHIRVLNNQKEAEYQQNFLQLHLSSFFQLASLFSLLWPSSRKLGRQQPSSFLGKLQPLEIGTNSFSQSQLQNFGENTLKHSFFILFSSLFCMCVTVGQALFRALSPCDGQDRSTRALMELTFQWEKRGRRKQSNPRTMQFQEVVSVREDTKWKGGGAIVWIKEGETGGHHHRGEV